MHGYTDAKTLAKLQSCFPSLQDFDVTSQQDTRYNCIAWAANRDDYWWWPDPNVYWPPEAPMAETSSAFIIAFSTLGYEPCDNGALEEGFEKVSIYATSQDVVTHMARQLPNGRWTSKLGNGVDIEHATPGELEHSIYGMVVQYMRRVLPPH